MTEMKQSASAYLPSEQHLLDTQHPSWSNTNAYVTTKQGTDIQMIVVLKLSAEKQNNYTNATNIQIIHYTFNRLNSFHKKETTVHN